VCGRLCTALLKVLLVSSSIHCSSWPASRRDQLSVCMKTPGRPFAFDMQRKDCASHASESPYRVSELQSTGLSLEPMSTEPFRPLTWSFRPIPCDGIHKAPGRKVGFASMTGINLPLISGISA
jgi:hypothetical protein